MRYLILCAAVFWANASYAADVSIHVDMTLSSYRVRPSPGPKTSHSSVDMVMHSDSTVDDQYSGSGPHPVLRQTTRRLGATSQPLQYRVINSHTITRRSKILLITVAVTENSCSASVIPTHAPSEEYETVSSELGTLAVFRDLRILSTSCTIR